MATKPVRLFGSRLHSTSFVIASESRVNCYYEVRKDEQGVNIVVKGTPGSYVKFSLPASPIRGMNVVGGVLYVVAGANLYSVTAAGVVTRLAGIGTSTGTVSMSDNYVQLIIVDGTYGYVYTIATAVLSQITDVYFPNGATTVTFLSGRFIVEKPNTREFYVSAALDGLTWTALLLPIYATKEQYSDLLRAVDSFNGVLVLWGESSIEYWQDAGLSPQPFEKITGSTQTYGLAAKASRSIINNSLYFLGIGAQGGYTVFAITGYAPTQVSTEDVEKLIASWAVSYTITDAVSMSYSIDGHDMYQITFPSANRSLLYDTTTQVWSIVQTGTAANRHYANIGVTFDRTNIFADVATSNIYAFSPVAYADNTTPIYRSVTSRHVRNGGNEFSISEVVLLMDTGEVPQGSDCKVQLSVSRDSGRTYGSPRPRTIGRVGQYKSPRVKWDRLGSSIDFVLKFSMVEQIPFVISEVEVE